MLKFVIAIFFLYFQSVLLYAQTENSIKDCLKNVQFGGAEICLPEIDGFTECYEDSLVKVESNKNKAEENLILAVYLPTYEYETGEDLKKLFAAEFIEVYASSILTMQIRLNEFEDVKKLFDSIFIKSVMSGIQESIDSSATYESVLIDSYVPDDKAKTYLTLITVELYGVEQSVLSCLTLLLLKERLIFLLNSKLYVGEEMIDEFKSRNERLTLKLIEMNN